MREIKFRAWDKDTNKFEENIINFYTIKDDLWNNNTKNKIFLQYTGLKDKNGKEIYEGDILNVNSNGVVEWNNELVGFITSDRNPNKPFYNILWASLVREGLAEIIGNIYENPELLTTNTQ